MVQRLSCWNFYGFSSHAPRHVLQAIVFTFVLGLTDLTGTWKRVRDDVTVGFDRSSVNNSMYISIFQPDPNWDVPPHRLLNYSIDYRL